MTILFIQHAGEPGGSMRSLQLTMRGLRGCGHRCVVALARPHAAIRAAYAGDGFEVIDWPLRCWDHSTVARRNLLNPLHLIDQLGVLADWRETKRRTLALVRQVRPDVVHLNSMPLSASASALADAGVPFAWHVREPAPDQSWRTRMIRRIMRRAPRLIFLSSHDREVWMGEPVGEVVPNFVDLRSLAPAVDRVTARSELGLPPESPVLLYLGGPAEVKGGLVLLKALSLLRNELPDLLCLMPSTEPRPGRSPVGRLVRALVPLRALQSPIQRFERVLKSTGTAALVRRMPFEARVEVLLAACDVLVFPAIESHFARPVIEAAALGRPAIASDVGGMRDLAQDGVTGLLVPPGDPRALADAIRRLFVDSGLRRNLGAAAAAAARDRFDMAKGVGKLDELLRQLARPAAVSAAHPLET